jgi:hypothetical protein
MSFRQSNFLLAMMATAMFAVLPACGTPKNQAPAIMIAFSTDFPPPAALAAGATAGIAAVVTNGPMNPTVKFTCIPVGACGTFTPNPIASNIPTQYQAPPVIPPGNTVTVTATSADDPTKSVSAMITID